ncbi:MAG: thioredoxin domain-containing protein [bacterium]
MEPQNIDQQNNNSGPTQPAKTPVITMPVAIIVAGFLIAAAVMFSNNNSATKVVADKVKAQPQAEAPQAVTSVPADVAKVRPNDVIRGNKNAEVVIIEYSDSDCPFCRRFHPTMQSIVKDYNGKVAWVYRTFPLSIHPNAEPEAIALTCTAKLGGNDSFWKYLDALENLEPAQKGTDDLLALGQKNGVSTASLKSCLSDSSIQAAVTASSTEAGTIGAQGTPFSIAVNVKTGKQQIIAGAYPEADVKTIVDSLLK